ncbi:MAG: ATP-dependent helicase [Candidatus Gastranaerophilales bacterium]|nr:ATP-dependent helicase [Candidatus Gastranaerophilales bacterium]
MPENLLDETKPIERKKFVLKKKTNIKTDYKINYEEELNQAQLEAVKTKDGSILVVAGAGTGKTKTLTYRCARLIEDGVLPENILLLTFTKKAAKEMLNRATLILDERCEKVAGGTFHSFANLILRKYSALLGLKNNFTIMDSADCQDVVQHITNTLFPKKEKRFPKKNTILEIYSKSINKETPVKEIIQKEYYNFSEVEDKIIEIHKGYVKYKRENSILDYDDLLLYLKFLLQDHENIRKKLSNQYKYIMVDEYQDTNTLQADIIKLLTSEHNNIMAVGDDAQSIYAFRGANYKNILDFPNIFPNTKIIKLEQNYRSSQNILDLTNAIISKAQTGYKKELFSQIQNPIKPALIKAINSQMEAEFICQKVLELLDEDISLNEICVLARNARMSYNLEIELSKCNIPFQKFGGPKFMEAAHIKDIIAHLRIILNPDDTISLNRILLLLKGIGSKAVSEIIPYMQAKNYNQKLLPSKYSSSLTPLFSLLVKNDEQNFDLQRLTEEIIRYYKPILKDKYDDWQKREKDLEHFLYLSTQYKKLDNFLSDLALEPPEASVEGMYKNNIKDDCLTISTIHSAKGLEWDSVFIIGAVDGRFPSAYSFNSTDEMEEELRLMYVATTRAKSNLFISYPIDMYDYATQMILTKPSRFLDNIDENLLEPWDIEEEN